MFGTIDCFLPCSGFEAVENTLRQLRGSRMIRHINLLVTQEFAMDNAVPDDCSFIVVDRLSSSSAMKSIAESVMADYAMMFLKDVSVAEKRGRILFSYPLVFHAEKQGCRKRTIFPAFDLFFDRKIVIV